MFVTACIVFCLICSSDGSRSSLKRNVDYLLGSFFELRKDVHDIWDAVNNIQQQTNDSNEKTVECCVEPADSGDKPARSDVVNTINMNDMATVVEAVQSLQMNFDRKMFVMKKGFRDEKLHVRKTIETNFISMAENTTKRIDYIDRAIAENVSALQEETRHAINDLNHTLNDGVNNMIYRADDVQTRVDIMEASLVANTNALQRTIGQSEKVTDQVAFLKDIIYIHLGYKRHGGSRYYLYNLKTNWTEAEQKCNELYGYLVEINDKDEYYFVMGLTTGLWNVWNGATDDGHEGIWRWAKSGNDVGDWLWKSGEPNNADSNEHCGVIIDYGIIGFNDIPCSNKHLYFLCEFPLV